jgi:TPR repeat protein
MTKKQRKRSTSSLKRESARLRSLIKRAEKGDAQAQYNLGLMMVIGEGVEKDLKKGMEWLE